MSHLGVGGYSNSGWGSMDNDPCILVQLNHCNKLIEQKNSARMGAIHLNSVSIAFSNKYSSSDHAKWYPLSSSNYYCDFFFFFCCINLSCNIWPKSFGPNQSGLKNYGRRRKSWQQSGSQNWNQGWAERAHARDHLFLMRATSRLVQNFFLQYYYFLLIIFLFFLLFFIFM